MENNAIQLMSLLPEEGGVVRPRKRRLVGMLKTYWNQLKTSTGALLKQKISPENLSLSLSLGFTLGLFPVPGTTMLLCGIVGLLVGLNQPAVQLVNILLTPVEIACIVPFLRFGEFITNTQPLSLSPVEFVNELKTNLFETLERYAEGILHAIFGWLVFLPIATLALYFLFLPCVNHALIKYQRSPIPYSNTPKYNIPPTSI